MRVNFRFQRDLCLPLAAVATCLSGACGMADSSSGSVAGKADYWHNGAVCGHEYRTESCYQRTEIVALQPDRIEVVARGDEYHQTYHGTASCADDPNPGVGHLSFFVEDAECRTAGGAVFLHVRARVEAGDPSRYVLTCLKFYGRDAAWGFAVPLAEATRGSWVTQEHSLPPPRDGFFAAGLATHGISGTYKCLALPTELVARGAVPEEMRRYGDPGVFLEQLELNLSGVSSAR